MRTRVGYAGGSLPSPTYQRLGDHSEVVQIDYDPERVSFADLLDVFWRSHNPAARPWSRQYMSAVFCTDEAQRRVGEVSRDRFEAMIGRPILTEMRPLEAFHVAEDYHQKHRLRAHPALLGELRAVYEDEDALRDSTAAARVNGYLDGGDSAALEAIVGDLGLSPRGRVALLERARSRSL